MSNPILSARQTGINHLRARNFRSFQRLELDLRQLNVIVGANASGKSNLIAAMRFLRDLAVDGLDDAISLQGGINYLFHARHGSEPFEIDVSYSQSGVSKGLHLLLEPNEDSVEFRNATATYKLKLASKSKLDYEIQEDSLAIAFECTRVGLVEATPEVPRDYNEDHGHLNFRHAMGQTSIELLAARNFPIREKALLDYARRWNLRDRDLLFSPATSILDFKPAFFFDDLRIFDFDPELARDAIFRSGKRALDDDGENLAIVLERILDNSRDKQRLESLMRRLVSQFDSLSVIEFDDLTALFQAHDKSVDRNFPATLLSPGTINTVAIIVALFFEQSPVLIFEEPDRHLHASSVAQLATMLTDRSKSRQVVLTTQNPKMIRSVSSDSVIGIYRDEHGYSHALPVAQSDELQRLLNDEIGLDDLNAAGLIRGNPTPT